MALVGTDVAWGFPHRRHLRRWMAIGRAPFGDSTNKALMDRIGAGPETAVLNLGGVGNVSWESARTAP